MIIQCDRCGTRYHFDETEITGEGAWVRCSRCAHVFFQEVPFLEPPAVAGEPEESALAPEVTAVPLQKRDDAPLQGEDTVPLQGRDDAPLGRTNFDDLSRILEEIDLHDGKPSEEKETVPLPLAENKADEVPVKPLKPLKPLKPEGAYLPGERRRTVRTVVTFFLTPLLIILIAASAYLWLFPEIGADLIERISGLPGLERIFGTEQRDGTISADLAAVDFTDIKERYVTNWIAGNILVVEGQAVNNNGRPVSDIRIRGKLIDTGGTVLAEQECYCGNILSDEELTNLTEKEMTDALSIPGGSSFSNRNIASRGSVPFMLVFANPVISVNEVAVVLAGIERAD